MQLYRNDSDGCRLANLWYKLSISAYIAIVLTLLRSVVAAILTVLIVSENLSLFGWNDI